MHMAETVLVVDDDATTRDVIVRYLEREGFEALEAEDGGRARAVIESAGPNLVILDLMLPGIDGLSVIRWMRSTGWTPVIMLTALGEETDRIVGLELGADDYVTKPFGVEEVLARLRAALRRSQAGEPSPPILRFGELEVDLGRRLVTLGSSPVHITKTEYGLLEAFVTNPGKLLTHQWLLRKVWGPGYAQESHYLRVYVRSLRRKLGDEASAPRLILTEPGVGYRWIAVRAEGDPS